MSARGTHTYVAFYPCGCLCGCVRDLPGDPKWTAGMVAMFIRDGHAVERVTHEAMADYPTGCEACRVPKQPSLLPAVEGS